MFKSIRNIYQALKILVQRKKHVSDEELQKQMLIGLVRQQMNNIKEKQELHEMQQQQMMSLMAAALHQAEGSVNSSGSAALENLYQTQLKALQDKGVSPSHPAYVQLQQWKAKMDAEQAKVQLPKHLQQAAAAKKTNPADQMMEDINKKMKLFGDLSQGAGTSEPTAPTAQAASTAQQKPTEASVPFDLSKLGKAMPKNAKELEELKRALMERQVALMKEKEKMKSNKV